MSVETKTSTFYHVNCDGCGARAPGSPIKDEAVSQAIKSEWEHVSWWNGLECIHRDLCPACYEEEMIDGIILKWRKAERSKRDNE